MACVCRTSSSCMLSHSSFSNSPSRSSKFFLLSASHRKRRPMYTPRSTVSDEQPDVLSEEGPTAPDPVKLAFAKSKEYLKEKVSKSASGQKVPAESPEPANRGGADNASPNAVRLAMKKAKEYRKSKGLGGSSGNIAEKTGDSGQIVMPVNQRSNLGEEPVDKLEKKGPTISSIDFVGLNFSDKKIGRGLPAGLTPVTDSFPERDKLDVEIIVGDSSKFDKTQSIQPPSVVNDENSKFYKPKVSTWGIYPRPENISKAFGGGRNIRPGEVLETDEVKAAKEAQSRQLIATYKSQIGLNIDPKTKAECEKALQDGDYLMELGKLPEALPCYEKVMEAVVFQSELHGLAALQWSICQDSLSRHNEARMMYEKLQSHPNALVSKKARQFAFSFQAMEMMKVSRLSSLKRTGYENYFEAFLEEKLNYSPNDQENDEGILKQVLPYLLFLLSPVLLIVFFASSRA